MPAVTMNIFQRVAPLLMRFASAVRASTPPSPSLSNLSMTHTYLIEMISIIAQNSADKVASTFGSLTASACGPLNASLKAYSGLVPMSP